MEAGIVIFLLCLLVIAVGFVTGYMSARRPRKANPVDARFVQCSGECGTRLALVGHKPQFGECVFCAKCLAKAEGK